MRFIITLVLGWIVHLSASAADFTVTNTADSGPGSLRQAIISANTLGTFDKISFSIPPTDPGYDPLRKIWIISPSSDLPMITNTGLLIDASTQTAAQGDSNLAGPEIMINGGGTLLCPFIILSSHVHIRGFIISGFTQGITIYNNTATLDTVTECYIGTDETGAVPAPNQYGISISGNANGICISKNLISGNPGGGIAIQNSENVLILANLIGTDKSGESALPNAHGILIDNGQHISIGGSQQADRNIISGNTSSGITINGLNAIENYVRGNYIGITASGHTALPNDFGVLLNGSSYNLIGGCNTGAGNGIGGNTQAGILIIGSGAQYNAVSGNLIGTDTGGKAPLPNYAGILLKSNTAHNTIGGNDRSCRNIISGNTEIGLYLEASCYNTIEYNFVGPDLTGTGAIMTGDSMFQGNGIELNTLSDHNLTSNNLISGNRVYGFILYGQSSHNVIENNLIGTDSTGHTAMKNATGICIDGASKENQVNHNTLSGNLSYGIFIVTTGTTGNQLSGNFIGTNSSGTDTVPNDIGVIIGGGASQNLIGGGSPNLISGNRFNGVEIADQHTRLNRISGNLIGTDISGQLPLPNGNGITISTFASGNTVDSNLIAGNRDMGVILYEHADSNTVTRNFIGCNADTTNQSLGNGKSGVLIMNASCHNKIGKTGAGNLIAHNGTGGVVITDPASRYNRISANSTCSTRPLGGIDLFPPGCNSNDAGDADTGPNDLINHPSIDVAVYDSVTHETVIWGTADIPDPDSATAEVFVVMPDSSGCGEGWKYLGGCLAFSGNHWSVHSQQISADEIVTATITDKKGNTSEFCSNVVILYGNSHSPYKPSEDGIKAYPNPFTGQITISAFGKNISSVCIRDISGRIISEAHTIFSEKFIWNGTSSAGDAVQPGIYFLSIDFTNAEAGNMIVIKQ